MIYSLRKRILLSVDGGEVPMVSSFLSVCDMTKLALVMTALPYIPSDIIKCIFAAFLGVKINTVLQKD